ncbi:cell division cycle protein 48 [Thraustotheca clavata]|uniref:Cell division cycle protein 48 n=1 Tax=Thraustotheca clavata TaxID=74557 RepID=A0A1W0A8A1_9STRA|nr:cell division cycle protein 48 [Thraustotheca clavata]
MKRIAWAGQGLIAQNTVRVFANADTQLSSMAFVRLSSNSASLVCNAWIDVADANHSNDIQLHPWMLDNLGLTSGSDELMCEYIQEPVVYAHTIVIQPLGPFPQRLEQVAGTLPLAIRDQILNLATTVTRQVELASKGHLFTILVLGQLYLFRVVHIDDGNIDLALINSKTRVVLQSNDDTSLKPNNADDILTKWKSCQWSKQLSTFGFAGYEDIIDDVFFHLRLKLFETSKFAASQGLLLQGVHGIGKTLFLEGIAKQLAALQIPVVKLECMSLLLESSTTASFSSTTDFLLHKLRLANDFGVILLDNVDAFFEDNEVSPLGRSLLQFIDELNNKEICILGTTTSNLPTTATRVGRFERCFELPVPTEETRLKILTRLLANIQVEFNDSAARVANVTGGYVAKDLVRVCRHAKASSKLANMPEIRWLDFVKAIGNTKPSQLKTLNVQAPGTALQTWEQFAGYESLKKKLLELISYRFERKEALRTLGVQSVSGILLYGPSGCGKTMIVQGLAAKCKANFVRVQSSELMSKYFGETEKSIRDVFARARSAAPCILFFDELDSIAEKRAFDGKTHFLIHVLIILIGKDSGGGASSVYSRVLSTLLNEMDGVSGQTAEVIVMAATNRKDALDPALIRPGRIDQALEVGYPSKEDRAAIFKSYMARMPRSNDVDIHKLASTAFDMSLDMSKMKRGNAMTGADIGAICKAAAFQALREDLNAQTVCMKHFNQAISNRLGRV